MGEPPPPRQGHCLCGAVTYTVDGPLDSVLFCHCVECRRWTGHYSATTACARSDLHLLERRGLRWVSSPKSETDARRGFCSECGSSLFWDSPQFGTISIAAGSLEPPSGLRAASHWYVSQAGDYYDLPRDGLLRHARRGEGELS